MITQLLILIALLQICTVALVLLFMRRNESLMFPSHRGKQTYKARNAMIEILVLKIRGYLTSVKWFAELLSEHSNGELTKKQTDIVEQLTESCHKAGDSVECILKSMQGTAKISDLQIFEASEEDLDELRKRHE